jgi:hypothetical protein
VRRLIRHQTLAGILLASAGTHLIGRTSNWVRVWFSDTSIYVAKHNFGKMTFTTLLSRCNEVLLQIRDVDRWKRELGCSQLGVPLVISKCDKPKYDSRVSICLPEMK